MLTVSRDDEHLFAALRAGVVGYLLKDIDPDRLPAALRAALAGEAALPRALVLRLMHELRDREPNRAGHRAASSAPALDATRLSNRERQVLELMQEGRSTREIADALFISPVTVRSHVASIVRKLHVGSRRDALRPIDEG